MVYKFKVTYEDHEDVFRHIEIKSSQSFSELHTAIQQAIGFDNSKSATFYTSDDYWRKEDEISVENPTEEMLKKSKTKKTEEVKKKKTIADHVDNPHQRFVYVFDPEREWTFLLELLKIMPEDKVASYPQCVKSMGVAPKQYKPSKLPIPVEDEDVKKGPSAADIEKDEIAPVTNGKEAMDDDEEGFTPLDEDGIEALGSGEDEEETSGESEDSETDSDDDTGGETETDEDESADR